MSGLKRCPYSLFQRLFSTLLYVAGTTGSVLIRAVYLIQSSLIERFRCSFFETTRTNVSQLLMTMHDIIPLQYTVGPLICGFTKALISL